MSLPVSPRLVAVFIVVLLATLIGCAGPVERQDDPVDDREFLLRERTIDPLGDVDDEFIDQTAPTILEFSIDDRGRIRIDILPYLLVDPGEQRRDEMDHQQFDPPSHDDQ